MKNAAEREALEYLRKDLLHNISMIGPIERGTAQILHTGDDGVMLRDKVSGAVMLSVSTYETGAKLLEKLPTAKLYLLHQGFMLEDLKAKVQLSNIHVDFTAAYFRDEPLPVRCDISIVPLDISALDLVERNYGVKVGADYLRGRLEAGALFGAFVEGELVGFGGEHEEGSLGMLVVLEPFRRRGYAASLVGFGVNLQLERKLTPFSCVGVDNLASIEMHKKLGFTVSADRVWWVF